MKTEPIKSFDQAESLIREALKGTEFENEELKECGGGDAPEDIKPLLISEVGIYRFMAVGFPEGGILFTITDDDDLFDEHEDLNEAIAKWNSLVSK